MEIKTHPIYESPQKDANDEKYGMPENACVCCGKPTDGSRSIHAITTWKAVNVAGNAEEMQMLTKAGMESQGGFSIGPSCAKKFPKEFIF